MAAAVGKEAFATYSSALIELMISIQESDMTQNDPQRYYLLGAWQRVCFIAWKRFCSIFT